MYEQRIIDHTKKSFSSIIYCYEFVSYGIKVYVIYFFFMDVQEHYIVKNFCVIDDRRKVFNPHIGENVCSDIAEVTGILSTICELH